MDKWHAKSAVFKHLKGTYPKINCTVEYQSVMNYFNFDFQPSLWDETVFQSTNKSNLLEVSIRDPYLVLGVFNWQWYLLFVVLSWKLHMHRCFELKYSKFVRCCSVNLYFATENWFWSVDLVHKQILYCFHKCKLSFQLTFSTLQYNF